MAKIPPLNFRNKSGFTLIELSIVLVIIGLIVGGVLVGRDLVAAAKLRRIVTEVDKYTASINTFRAKYNCLPGDCKNATTFFTSSINGNGDGKINADFYTLPSLTFYSFQVNTADTNGNTEEVTLLNEHLAQSGLIPLAPFDRAGAVPVDMANKWYVNVYGKTTNLMALTNGYGRNLIRLNAVQSGASSQYIYFQSPSGTGLPALQPEEAFVVDSKIDDGLPHTGSVLDEVFIGGVDSGSWNANGDCATWDGGGWLNRYNVGHIGPYYWGTYEASTCGLSIYGRF